MVVTEKKLLGSICLLSLVLFSPSLFLFFTHDDFFFLHLSKISSLGEFVNFFNLVKAPEEFGFYRPLTTQVFYFIAHLTGLNPFFLHIISSATFSGITLLVYQLTYELFPRRKAALIASFLYATSATHFGHLYFLGTFHELGLTLFYLLGCLHFVKYIKSAKKADYLIVLISFAGALGSKEFAVTFPFACLLLWLYLKYSTFRISTIAASKLAIICIPLLVILSLYLYLHIFHFGLVKGDSYVWDFSSRVFNTLFWYLVWSFNLPEMFVDYVGAGFELNPHLLEYYGTQSVSIFILFLLLVCLLAVFLVKSLSDWKKKLSPLLYWISWFLLTLSPIVFLPWHKFTYELTVPLVGVVIGIGFLLTVVELPQRLTYLCLITWMGLSMLTLQLTASTHWISQGSAAAHKIDLFLSEQMKQKPFDTVVFYQTETDSSLPWNPVNQIQVVLSDQDYFSVFFNGQVEAVYKNDQDFIMEDESTLYLQASHFLYVE